MSALLLNESSYIMLRHIGQNPMCGNTDFQEHALVSLLLLVSWTLFNISSLRKLVKDNPTYREEFKYNQYRFKIQLDKAYKILSDLQKHGCCCDSSDSGSTSEESVSSIRPLRSRSGRKSGPPTYRSRRSSTPVNR